MTAIEVKTLMFGSRTEQEWNANADKVKAACGGYPGFWFPAIIQSGLIERVAPRWGGSGRIEIVTGSSVFVQ